jgi:hypothetical protein
MATNKSRTVSTTLTTSNQDVYTAPDQYSALVRSILISNTTSTAKTVSMDWYDDSETSYHTLMEATSIPANGIVQITDVAWLDRQDKIRALASANSSIEISIFVQEVFG